MIRNRSQSGSTIQSFLVQKQSEKQSECEDSSYEFSSLTPLQSTYNSKEIDKENISTIFFVSSIVVTTINTINMFDFQNLTVYKKSKAFHVSCKNIVLEKELDRYVNDQLGRASFSIPLNIAEGSGKF